ncbi:hypothetical protein [Peterkaempfera sp. SMS 1(5)a]|uniref:hypothetical protein n=1 Tax=Peterkaempfera podocarpi TaxID=3232308 RepID=UPI00366B07AA
MSTASRWTGSARTTGPPSERSSSPRGCVVHDGADTLHLSLEAQGQPVAVALWRNLRGFPQDAPYRSVGVEPMLGRVFDRAAAGDGDTAVVPPSGTAAWRLTVTATRRP